MNPRVRRTLAWLVHAYTALGLLLAGGIAVLVVQGSDEALRGAFLLMAAAMAVDSSDGWMARRVGVAEVTPALDGRRLDDIIDFHTFVSLPLLLIWRAEVLPGPFAWSLLVPLVASAYGFSRVDAKTEDGYFLGFPSCWNVVALYLFFLQPTPALSAVILLVLAALVVLPSRYLNPGQPGGLNQVTVALGVAWGVMVVGVLLGALSARPWIEISLFFPAFYLLASWTVSLGFGRGAEKAARG